MSAAASGLRGAPALLPGELRRVDDRLPVIRVSDEVLARGLQESDDTWIFGLDGVRLDRAGERAVGGGWELELVRESVWRVGGPGGRGTRGQGLSGPGRPRLFAGRMVAGLFTIDDGGLYYGFLLGVVMVP